MSNHVESLYTLKLEFYLMNWVPNARWDEFIMAKKLQIIDASQILTNDRQILVLS